jgi:hypothetical protein
MKGIKSIALLAIFSIGIAACEKKPDPATTPTPTPTTGNGEVGFEFANMAGGSELVFNTGSYTNAAGETFTVSKFNYYITNIKLKKADGSEYAEPESYHLVEGDVAASRHIHIKNVTKGTYTSASFLIGVDEARNTSGAQTGALDPAKGMFWSWTTGYIMAKLEGTSPAATTTDKKFVHHIGGFNGANSSLRTVTITFPQPMEVSSAKELSIKLKADVLKWFAPGNVTIAANSTLMSVNAASKTVADNYANMFSVSSIVLE